MGWWSKSQWTQTECYWASYAVSVSVVAVSVEAVVAVAGVTVALAEGTSGVAGAAE